MPADILTTQLSVGPLASNATVTVAHGIHYGGQGRAPNIVIPDRVTAISVLSVTATTITFKNSSDSSASANFLVELEHTIQRDSDSTATLFWQGSAIIPPSPSSSQMVYVNKGGSDVTGNGSFANPFLTIAAALASITDNDSTKRYQVIVGPGGYADPFLIKPWTAIVGADFTSGFYGITEITAPANTVALDPSFNVAPFAAFAVCWLSNLVFANAQTFSYATPAHPQITCDNCDWNGGVTFTGDGTSGTANAVLSDNLVFGGATCQGWQFLWSFGGCQFLGGTVLIQSAANAGAAAATTWLAQDTAIGATFSPTNVTCKWAAPTPVGIQAKLDFCNTSIVGTLTIDGAHTTVNATSGGIPPTVSLLNGAPSPILKTDATGIGYTPSPAGNWAGPAPTTIQQALDRLATLVKTLNGGVPIP